ncbi:hypothetical protein TNCV_2759631 [Trichonephila clavipes]|nr:hypothetical protein TNCV_2759631 [Trichonephila clavipes]
MIIPEVITGFISPNTSKSRSMRCCCKAWVKVNFKRRSQDTPRNAHLLPKWGYSTNSSVPLPFRYSRHPKKLHRRMRKSVEIWRGGLLISRLRFLESLCSHGCALVGSFHLAVMLKLPSSTNDLNIVLRILPW